ncbi:anthranilate synthase component I [Clostridium sp. BJN0001]|uniref:anthranilate synthase component I n=1 Tax=Clostridium sp. BJN0001 TaxID=2930219 RepID=UPI001FD1317F|nr:anthranilate synthase component I [Clostridium sp. BJN0001]
MINIKKDEFLKRKEEGKVFSLISEFRGDEITPIRIFNGFKGKRKFIFESGSKENYFGRYSYIGENPCKEIKGDTLKEIEELKAEIRVQFSNESNPFSYKGGAIGYMGYDTVALFEKKLEFKNKDDLNIPLIRFNIYNRYICYDHFTHKVFIIDNIKKDDTRDYDFIVKDQKKYIKDLINYPADIEEIAEDEDISFKLLTSKEKYMENVEKAKDHILRGDIFQVVPSLRMKCDTKKSYIDIYRKLRETNPSPYMYLIDYDEYQVIGSSPETVVTVRKDEVITKPIAGTKKRGKTPEEDNKLSDELLKDKKELAEHVMLVDLGRNDIGRISKVGSVHVNDFMKVEKFSHVMHITSTVKGKLLDNIDGFDALSACLPAGTLSGAPKIRAMEIIEELEDYKRGLYAGSVGYFSYGGNTDMAIAIRTLLLKDKTAYIQAGAGIVYDSIAENEFNEVQNKLMALKEALR